MRHLPVFPEVMTGESSKGESVVFRAGGITRFQLTVLILLAISQTPDRKRRLPACINEAKELWDRLEAEEK